MTYYFGSSHQWDVNIYNSSNYEVWRDPQCVFYQALTKIILLPYSEYILCNLSWDHFDEVIVSFGGTIDEADSIISKYNGTIIRRFANGQSLLVRVHEDDTETFIEEIQKEDGVRYAEPNYDMVLNGIPVTPGTYTIRGTLYGHEIYGEKTIQIK